MNNKFFKLLLGAYLIALFTLPLASQAGVMDLLNATAGSEGAGYDTSAEVAQTGVSRIAGVVVRAFLSLLGVIFLSYTFYGGFLWLTAAGNEEKVEKSKKILRDGVIGLIITLSAVSIYYFIANVLMGSAGNIG